VAVFVDVGTLTKGDPVKVNGVKKGRVTDIRLKGNRVEVTMSIEKDVQITQDSRIVIQNIGLMGERMIGIRLGTGEPLQQGQIMEGQFDSGIAEAMGMLGEVLREVQATMDELQSVVKNTVGNEQFQVTFNRVTTRLDETTGILKRKVAQNKDALQSSIEDLQYTSHEVRGFMANNKDRLNKTVGNVEDITNQTKDMLARADKISADIQEILGRMNSDRSSIGRLMADTAFAGQLKETIQNADSLVRQIKKKGINVRLW
jgi:phospholipid/cholesterol/gamma-HCH transport system substrate-binding protein